MTRQLDRSASMLRSLPRRVALARAWVVLALALCWHPGDARAQEQSYVHIVREGETLASIAQAYYGEPRRELVLRNENGLAEGELPAVGMRLVLPAVRYHRVLRGESWRSIAELYYGDGSRAVALLRANHVQSGAQPLAGAELLVPYPVRHLARSSESLASVAERFYGSRDEVRLLRAFNGAHGRVSRGQTVLVPLFDLTFSRSALERLQHSANDAASEAERRAQDELARDIPRVHALIQEGRFVEAAALGNQLLGRGQLTGNQEISIQRELATAYVALARDDLAIYAFARALEKQPDLELDSVRTSPRVLAALEAAKHLRTK
jgi:hypothetical protein